VKPSGVLVIDKPVGPTSHDVVAMLRRALGTREIGHAGTLDPAASGVLVVAIGEGTKLSRYLTSEEKSYDARITLGRSTTTLDAEGETVEEAPVLPWTTRDLSAALEAERARTEQIPPAFSAIKLGGRPAYESARRGRPSVMAKRAITVRSLSVIATSPDSIALSLTASKGYYVRSLARDLGARLGMPAHLSMLRRTRSGTFTLAEALSPEAPPDDLASAILPVAAAAARVLPIATLTREGADHAAHGRPLGPEHFEGEPPAARAAWLAPDGRLVAIGSPHPDKGFAVERGLRQDTSSDPTSMPRRPSR
jgi:tRNA pseudouridine55 synthase